ncbi:LPD28 domain-containing protein [Ruminococcus sp.]|uniref:LPD28 domain-containing protein n=1 Tax=Ruminococcus sp. TaxID=41978 RepID=UPI00397582F6
MPNHITTQIKITGDPEAVKRVLNKIKNDEFGMGTIDFEKIIPMPKNIFKGNLGVREWELYGNNNWYDWSVANWGTKWNAYGFDPNTDYSKEKELKFLTAWSAPHPVIAKLSEMFPSVKLEHEWADEDIGMNCGRHVYYDGERIEEYYPESEMDRLEFAASVLDIQLEEDCGLYLNASETEYINIEYDDEYELIELFGQPALFTNNRITDVDIPKGMYCYHIRHGDEGEFVSIEKRTEVNHAGSVVTREPIDLGEQGYISFTEETSPDFKGEIMSLYEFWEYDPEQSQTEDMEMEMK